MSAFPVSAGADSNKKIDLAWKKKKTNMSEVWILVSGGIFDLCVLFW